MLIQRRHCCEVEPAAYWSGKEHPPIARGVKIYTGDVEKIADEKAPVVKKEETRKGQLTKLLCNSLWQSAASRRLSAVA